VVVASQEAGDSVAFVGHCLTRLLSFCHSNYYYCMDVWYSKYHISFSCVYGESIFRIFFYRGSISTKFSFIVHNGIDIDTSKHLSAKSVAIDICRYLKKGHNALLDGSGKGNRLPFSGPLLTKTNGLYSSSFSISAEFSKRFSIAAFP
jgi:hypothetical protein